MEIWRTRHSICAKGRGPDVGSTVPGEDVLNRGHRRSAVASVVRDLVNTGNLGNTEFACKVTGAKRILVTRHSYRGPVGSVIDGAEPGNSVSMLSTIGPVVQSLSITRIRGRVQRKSA